MSTPREQACDHYNELLEKVGEVLGPDHRRLMLDLDRAVGDYVTRVAQAAVQDHGLQILEMIEGADFDYKFLEKF